MEADRLSGKSQLKSCPFCNSENIGRKYTYLYPLEYWDYCKDCDRSIRYVIADERGAYEVDFSKVWEVSDE